MRALSFFLAAGLLAAQTTALGTVERVKLHGVSLEGNLAGDSPDRDISVYLPPSYAKEKKRRYPVVYLLHGFTDSDEKWFGHGGVKHWMNLPATLNQAIGAGAREMIVVMPNAYTRFQGSFYGNSANTGNWEEFITKELVAFVDSRYRSIAKASHRGLAGHSMGGYGTLRLGMKFPEVFSVLYALSPCCLSAPDPTQARPGMEKLEAIREQAEIDKANFMVRAMFASAAAWSPNPAKPPFYVDLPTEGGKPQAQVYARWAANAPISMADQYIPNLRKLRAIAMDAGDKDVGIANTVKTLSAYFNGYSLKHVAEIYEGDHVNRIAERIEKKVMPFFSQQFPASPN